MKKLAFLIFLFSFQYSFGQEFFRLKADVSIKDKLSTGAYRLTVGKVYYDKPTMGLVYKLHFPQEETIIIKDTTLYRLNKKDSLLASQTVTIMNEFSIFHLSLSGKLADYGINSGKVTGVYKIEKVEKDANGRVITTWKVVEKRLLKILGKIKMANIDKKLDAIAFYDVSDKLLSQQFFKDYVNVKGVVFPQQVTQISYNSDGTQNIQQTTYKNIVIDENGEDTIYNHSIPVAALPKSGNSPK
ncbi:hypothetical protein [Emticicia sp. BO119]|uniref:hypothetical protein n=1 Tax=Emticicia sp. BO119 TaxID=2757768 RepID=UPI0015F00724|nr:hypothetical protein [Emticicia sp. BO119]MBA4851915.1 hypothetical protein [Emticicia sp. BO119]